MFENIFQLELTSKEKAELDRSADAVRKGVESLESFWYSPSSTLRRAQISALALFHRILWLFGSLPGVAIHLLGAHLPKDIDSDYTLSGAGSVLGSRQEDGLADP